MNNIILGTRDIAKIKSDWCIAGETGKSVKGGHCFVGL